jgi:integrase
MPELPDNAWLPARFDVSRFDRTPEFTAKERERIAAVVTGESLHLRLGDPLSRLLEPLKSCLRLTEAQQSQHSMLRHLVAEMHDTGTVFWVWKESTWTSLYYRCKAAQTAANTRQHVLAMAALLCAVDLPGLRNQECHILRRRSLASKIFGREAVHASINRVQAELKRLGYTGNFHLEVQNALCELFLVNRSAELATLTAESLEHLRSQECTYGLKQATFMLSHAFVALGILSSPLAPYISLGRRRCVDFSSIDPMWLSWCTRWYEMSTLRPSTRKSVRCRLRVVGRWLKAKHPDVSRPDQWTRQLAAEYVAATGVLRVGEFVDDRQRSYPDRLLSISSRLGHLSALRCFFTDLLLWELVPRRFDPRLAFRFPRSLALLRSPNPRIIAEDVWAKLLWAGLNLEQTDLPISSNALGQASLPRYPLVMIRALAMVWLFAGLRKDEIARLRIDCVRRQSRGVDPQGKEDSSVCLLDVPANKTSGAYTKPVHGAVRETIKAWQELRPAMQAVTDEKTGERFHVLFSYRGRAVGSSILNHTLIPMLCRKAGVPGTDARGAITSHRARSTIATQLYNAKEPMSLVALKEWLGHRCLASTQWYATVSPDRLTQAYVDARYFERNVAVVQVLLDRDAIESGAAGRGEAYKFVHLGHGLCSNPYWAQCQHRMACQRCDFYVPGDSTRAQALEANTHNQRLLEQIPVTEAERKALAGDRAALKQLIEAGQTFGPGTAQTVAAADFVTEISPGCTAGRDLQLQESS